MSYVVSLSELDTRDLPRYGAKAVRLGELIRSGLNVPFGYAINTDLHQQLMTRLSPELGRSVAAANERVVVGITAADLPVDVLDEFRTVWDALLSHGTMVPVRSSAPHEDGTCLSFAGIYDSFTEISTFGEMAVATKLCIASLYSDRALEYALENSLDPDGMYMAVILQTYAVGKPSGVAFTTDFPPCSRS